MSGGRMINSMAGMLTFQLPRAAAVLKSAVEAELEPLSLRTSEATLLIYLGEHDGSAQGEAGRDLRIKPANMVPLVARLTAAGLVQRIPGEGRTITLHLTADGGRKLTAVRQTLQRLEDRIDEHLAREDKAAMIEALVAIVERECGKI